jgi:hypothetical protein
MPKFVASMYTLGFYFKELIAESPFIFLGDTFPAFSAGNQFCDL